VSCFRFIAAEKANYPVSLLCRMLGVSRSGFHAWAGRAPSERSLVDARLIERIGEIHKRSRESYGARRIHLDLRDEGVRIGRKRVERLMRAAEISGYVKRRKFKTTIRVPGVRVAADLVERDFDPAAANQLWASDIKYVPTCQGTLYLASVIDCYSRRVVGWSMRDEMPAELVVGALEMAISRRRPAGKLVHHSDQGSQGGFKWLSQHLVREVVRDGCWGSSAGDPCDARADVVAGPAVGGAAGGAAAVLAGDRGWMVERGGGCGGGGVAGGWQPVVPRRWRDAANLIGPAVGALSLVC
jgi:putative transposase